MEIRRETFWKRHFSTGEAGFNLSWGSVIAGVVTFIATFLLLSLITTAIGFGALKPTSDQPFNGVGIGLLIWTVIATLIALFAAGFVSGLSARRTGLLHGFLTWAVSLLVMTFLVTSSVAGAVGVLGRVVGSTLGVAGQAAGAVTKGVGDLAGSGFEKLGDQFKEIDTKAVQADIQKVLKDTDEPVLQPDYLSKLLDDSKNDILDGGKQILTDPSKADEVFKQIGDQLSKRAETVAQAADKDAIARAVAKNTDLSKAEAQQAVENIHQGLQKAAQEAEQQIKAAQQALEEAKTTLDQTIQEARQTAEKATHSISVFAIILFIGQLIGLLLTAFAGYIGASKTKQTIAEA